MLRPLLLALVVAPLLLLASTAAAAGDPAQVNSQGAAGLQGDVNCSAAVDPIDSLQVLRNTAGLSINAKCLADAGDVDCDGDADSTDALRILRFVASLPVMTPDGCVPIGDPLAPPPTSEELIAAALARHEISYEDSLLDRAYALYDLPELPAPYRSPVVDMHAAMSLLLEIEQRSGELSKETLDKLAPFRARPADPVSIFNNPPASRSRVAGSELPVWVNKSAAGGKVRVWVKQSDGSDAELTAYANEVGRVWPQLPGLIRYGNPDTPGDPSVNPDDATDIYFVDVGAVDQRKAGCRLNPNNAGCTFNGRDGGYTGVVSPHAGNTWAAYVVIDSAVSGTLLTSHIAHELFHTAQFSYDAYESPWLLDATATWGAFRVLKKLGVTPKPEYDYLPDFFKELDKTLTRDPEGGGGKGAQADAPGKLNRYASWLYFYFASMQLGDGVVTQIWQAAAADGVQGEKAVDQVMPFENYFDDFTVRNWNEKPPLMTAYKDSDSSFPSEKPGKTNTFLGSPGESALEIALDPLAAHYEAFTFADSIRTIVFENKLSDVEHLHVWGLVKIGGEWKPPEDWSDIPKKDFCRDDPEQNVTELVIIVSNSDMTSSITPPEDAVVKGKAAACTNWRGTIRWTTDETISNVHFSVTSVADVYFKNVTETPGTTTCDDGAGTLQPCETYFASGTVTYDSTAVVPDGCTTTIGPATGTIVTGHSNDGQLIVYTTPDPPTYEGIGQTFVTGTSTDVCPGDPPQSSEYHDADIWFCTPEMSLPGHCTTTTGLFQLKDHGALIEDTFTRGHMVYTWHLKPAP